jgi:hypothetical protein
MSAILTYLRFNVTKLPAAAKHYVVLPAAELIRPERASDGGKGRELIYRAIVERHFGKHTGLRHAAKACPEGLAMVTRRKTGGEAQANQQAPRRGRVYRADPGESHGSFYIRPESG